MAQRWEGGICPRKSAKILASVQKPPSTAAVESPGVAGKRGAWTRGVQRTETKRQVWGAEGREAENESRSPRTAHAGHAHGMGL